VAGLGADLGEFVAVDVGLVFGAFGPGPQVGAQFATGAGGLSAEIGQHLRVGADPGGLCLGGSGGADPLIGFGAGLAD
jgi:hypothetical protein